MAKIGYNNDGEPAKYCRKVIDGGYCHSVSKSLQFNDGHCMFSELKTYRVSSEDLCLDIVGIDLQSTPLLTS